MLSSHPSYHQARAAAAIGLRKLEELGIPTERPEDYFAEMIKGDDHMRKVKGCGLGCGFITCVIFDWCFKVREDLMSRKKMADNREKARKTRELKKYGKKVCT